MNVLLGNYKDKIVHCGKKFPRVENERLWLHVASPRRQKDVHFIIIWTGKSPLIVGLRKDLNNTALQILYVA